MPFAHLSVRQAGDVLVIGFTDSAILDTAKVEQIGRELNQIVESRKHSKILLDFANVRLLSSSALGILATLHKRVRQLKQRLVISGLRRDLRKVFSVTGLEKLFEFVDDEAAGLAALIT